MERDIESYVVQLGADGKLELPTDFRAEFNLEAGDPLTIIRIDGHLIIVPTPLVVFEALDRLNALMAETNTTWDELMLKGREFRARRFEAQYGTRPVA